MSRPVPYGSADATVPAAGGIAKTAIVRFVPPGVASVRPVLPWSECDQHIARRLAEAGISRLDKERAVASDVGGAIETAAMARKAVDRVRELPIGHVLKQHLAGFVVEDAQHALRRAGDDGAIDQQRRRRHAETAAGGAGGGSRGRSGR